MVINYFCWYLLFSSTNRLFWDKLVAYFGVVDGFGCFLILKSWHKKQSENWTLFEEKHFHEGEYFYRNPTINLLDPENSSISDAHGVKCL